MTTASHKGQTATRVSPAGSPVDVGPERQGLGGDLLEEQEEEEVVEEKEEDEETRGRGKKKPKQNQWPVTLIQ